MFEIKNIYSNKIIEKMPKKGIIKYRSRFTFTNMRELTN